MAATLSRYRNLPLPAPAGRGRRAADRPARAAVLSLAGLPPRRHPRLPAFTSLRRDPGGGAGCAGALSGARPARALLPTRVPGLHSVHVLLLGATWLALLAGLAVQVPAIVRGASGAQAPSRPARRRARAASPLPRRGGGAGDGAGRGRGNRGLPLRAGLAALLPSVVRGGSARRPVAQRGHRQARRAQDRAAGRPSATAPALRAGGLPRGVRAGARPTPRARTCCRSAAAAALYAGRPRGSSPAARCWPSASSTGGGGSTTRPLRSRVLGRARPERAAARARGHRAPAGASWSRTTCSARRRTCSSASRRASSPTAPCRWRVPAGLFLLGNDPAAC